MSEEQGKGSERATLHAVASLAGVSLTTVSLVLAGKGGTRRISESTHRRVHRAAEELNYAPNLLTRSLRRGRTHILSFFSSYRNRERNDLYMSRLSSAMETAGGAEGYDILVHCNFARSPKEIYQFLNGGLADGLLLFAPRPDDPLLALLRKSNLPVVIINGQDPEGRYSSVTDDMGQGMRLVADELIAYGHRQIAILTADYVNANDAHERVKLLRALLRERGIDVPDRWVREAREATVASVLTDLRQEGDLPTAVFCWHDRLAYSLLTACEAQGLSVPGDISVIGYDGIHWPSLTSHVVASVHVDFDDLSLTAVRLLDRAIVNPDGHAEHRVLPVSFLRGSSLGAARNATEQ